MFPGLARDRMGLIAQEESEMTDKADALVIFGVTGDPEA